MTQALANRPVRAPAAYTTAQLDAMNPASDRFDPHPEGTFVVRCVDAIDMGVSTYQKKERRRFAFVFVSDQVDEKGEPKIIRHYVTPSLFEGGKDAGPSKHLKMLRQATGRPNLTRADLPGYDTSKMVGLVCRVIVTHKPTQNGRTYAAILEFKRAAAGDKDKPIALEDYYRPDWLHATSVEGQEEAAESQFNPKGDAIDVQAGGDGGGDPFAAPEEPQADEPPPPDDSDQPADLTEDSVPF